MGVRCYLLTTPGMILQVDIDLVILGCRPFFSQVFKNGGSKIRNHTIWKKKQDTLWTGWGTDSSEMMAIYVNICIYTEYQCISPRSNHAKAVFFQVVSLHGIYSRAGCYFSTERIFSPGNSGTHQSAFKSAPKGAPGISTFSGVK